MVTLDDAARKRRDRAIARLGILERVGDPGLTALTRLTAYVAGARGAAIDIFDGAGQRRIATANVALDGDDGREQADVVVASLELQTSDDVVIGTLDALDERPVTLDEEQRARLADLADQIVAQIELIRVAVDLGHLASQDALTGAVNRLVLGDRLAQAFARRRRQEGETFLALIRVDCLKAVRELHGHDAGDEALVAIAARLRETMREHDTVARVGHDRFAVLAELVAAPGAEHVLAERIARALAPPIVTAATPISVQVSIGCVLATVGEPLRELLGRADEARETPRLAAR